MMAPRRTGHGEFLVSLSKEKSIIVNPEMFYHIHLYIYIIYIYIYVWPGSPTSSPAVG